MGYDKGDISFVIHYQMPSNIVSYYQQIGRAGRNIDKAYVFLMYGKEDEEIIDYFINTAFPTESETNRIIEFVGGRDGVKGYQIVSALNIRKARIDKALSFLENDGFIRRDKGTYFITPKKYRYDREHYDSVTAIRIMEKEQMKQLAKTKGCYSKYIVSCLDDIDAHNCGHCSNCVGHELFPSRTTEEYIHLAEEYINGLIIPIEPRKMWACSGVTKQTKISFINQPGICLSVYGDSGYGELVKRGKYSAEKKFCDELVGKSAEVLRPHIRENGISHVCCVPSLRSNLVKDFSARLADALGISFVELLEKTDAVQQKKMENSSHQCANAYKSFSIKRNLLIPKNILLVDDVVDSKWTLTVCGYRLMEAGAQKVFPFALADSSNRED